MHDGCETVPAHPQTPPVQVLFCPCGHVWERQSYTVVHGVAPPPPPGTRHAHRCATLQYFSVSAWLPPAGGHVWELHAVATVASVHCGP